MDSICDCIVKTCNIHSKFTVYSLTIVCMTLTNQHCTKTSFFELLALATKALDSHPPSAELHTGTRYCTVKSLHKITCLFIMRASMLYCENIRGITGGRKNNNNSDVAFIASPLLSLISYDLTYQNYIALLQVKFIFI